VRTPCVGTYATNVWFAHHRVATRDRREPRHARVVRIGLLPVAIRHQQYVRGIVRSMLHHVEEVQVVADDVGQSPFGISMGEASVTRQFWLARDRVGFLVDPGHVTRRIDEHVLIQCKRRRPKGNKPTAMAAQRYEAGRPRGSGCDGRSDLLPEPPGRKYPSLAEQCVPVAGGQP
jgi:hypothetical protein